ncbi:MAG: thiosulfate oxidation carrier protein SoxY [Candidatus Thiodiazotropha lotti]|nr:thiosulfate oxidation carrier protein SoxY [Candidatus Thiodiazotropha lotti]
MTQKIQRRLFLKVSLSAGLISTAIAAGLLIPQRVFAIWDLKAFSSKKVEDALMNGLGSAITEMSDAIHIDAPDVAADGSTVPINVATTLPNVESIAVLAEKNPRPLCSIIHPGPGIRSKVGIRIKMGKTADVIAVIKSNGRLFMARRTVKVTASGCA